MDGPETGAGPSAAEFCHAGSIWRRMGEHDGLPCQVDRRHQPADETLIESTNDLGVVHGRLTEWAMARDEPRLVYIRLHLEPHASHRLCNCSHGLSEALVGGQSDFLGEVLAVAVSDIAGSRGGRFGSKLIYEIE